MTFDEWLEIGIANRWATPVVCTTHDGLPMSETEQDNFDYDDICVHAIRVCQPAEWQDIYDNTPAMKWRHNQ